MFYTTLDKLKTLVEEQILIQLTDDKGLGQIDLSIVDESIIYSSTLIDGYLRGRYSLPLSEIPKILEFVALDLCIHRLYSRRLATDMPDSINEKYKTAIKILEQIQKGILSLGIESTGTAPEFGEYRTNKNGAKEFSNEVLDAY